jgi:hypothetical protein
MAVNQVTVSELLQISQGSLNVGVQTVRTTFDYANRKIVSLQKHLQDLKAAYILALQNINRNLTKEELDKYFSPDRFQTIDPTQVIKPYDAVGPDPDSRINRIRRRLDEITGEQKKELVRLEDEIKKVSAMITRFTQMRNGSLAELALMEDVNVISARDNIARVQYETIYILEQISKRYLDLSTDASGNRITSSSAPITRQYKILQDAFRGYASRDPDVQKGTLKLLLEDPGAPENRAAIKAVLDRRSAVLADNENKLPPDLIRFNEKMNALINDSFISQNVSRQATEKRLPASDNSVTNLVDNLDKKLGNMFTVANNILSGLTPAGKNTPKIFGKDVNAIYDSTGFSGAVTNWFNRVMQNNYDGVPLCGVVDTSIAQAKATDSSNKQQAEIIASGKISDQLSKTTETTSPEIQKAKVFLSDALAEVIKTVNELEVASISWNNQLTLNRTSYTSVTYHDSKVLDKARQAADSALRFWVVNKYISYQEYSTYLTSLEEIIKKGTACVSVDRYY